MPSVASDLINKLLHHGPPRIRKSTRRCLEDVHGYLVHLKNRCIKKDLLHYPNDLIHWVYGSDLFLKNKHEVHAYLKYSLTVAVHCFSRLIDRIKADKGNLSHKTILEYKEHIVDFIFDIKPVVEYFEQKRNKDFVFFGGGKSYTQQSWQIFREANIIYWSSTTDKNVISHRIALNLSMFALRQSLELKVRRILGIGGIYNKKFKSPRIRHDYFAEFIQNHLHHFEMRHGSIKNIMTIYKWTNFSVHSGAMPRTWEAQYALEYCDGFFAPIDTEIGKAWSIHNAVQISNYYMLVKALTDQISVNFQNDIWCTEFGKPEALIKS